MTFINFTLISISLKLHKGYQKMKKGTIIALVFILLLLLISTWAFSQYTTDKENSDITENVIADEDAASVSKTFVLTGVNFKFLMEGQEAPELRVKEGDKVRIEFTSTDGFHDWVVDGFNAATERVQTDGSTFVEFVADKKGTFEYYCSVGEHRVNGMVGNLIVE